LGRPGKNADNEGVKDPRRRALTRTAALILLLLITLPLPAYWVTYKEQYYRLFHLHYIQSPDDTLENIYWLEKAIQADFANPLYALCLIENQVQWEKYRYLFNMHLHLRLIEQYLFLGNKWNKREAYFYNAPFREQNLESLNTAEACYRAALSYWDTARQWAERSLDRRFRFINLRNIQFWEDEAGRIESGSLDYGKTITRELERLQRVRETFEAMDETTY
jgi:hypothetical protein